MVWWGLVGFGGEILLDGLMKNHSDETDDSPLAELREGVVQTLHSHRSVDAVAGDIRPLSR